MPDRTHEYRISTHDHWKLAILQREQRIAEKRNSDAFWKILLVFSVAVAIWVGIWYAASWFWSVL